MFSLYEASRVGCRAAAAREPRSRLQTPQIVQRHCLTRPATRPRQGLPIHSHLTKQAAVARESTRRGMISPPVKCIISTTWYLYRAAGSSSSSSCQRGYQLHPSRPGWPGAAWIACADRDFTDKVNIQQAQA